MTVGDWWTKNITPWSGCKDLATPAGQRAAGCQKCWLPSLLTGPRGRVIHGDRPPWEIALHPGRLAQALQMKKPQRFGWINGEVADVATDHPEYLAACVGVAQATPHHGFGVPTSDPGPLVTWARWLEHRLKICGSERYWMHLPVDAPKKFDSDAQPPKEPPVISIPRQVRPRNWLWLISASTQREVDERLPHALALARLGWRWGWHCEPALEPLSLIPDAYGMDLRDAPFWIVSGPPKGHKPTDGELDWHRAARDQAHYAGVPYWYKGVPLDGWTNELPAGWPR